MGQLTFPNLREAMLYCRHALKHFGSQVATEKWQGIEHNTDFWELNNLHFSASMPQTVEQMQLQTKADLPWAEDHFVERVSGNPLNPGEQYKNWPHYGNKSWNDLKFRNVDEKFTHTYMERYWPKYKHHGSENQYARTGIRYEYGDLLDVIGLLQKQMHTRQAYLPIWFPEDTGVLHNGRVPCSIGYHFLVRNGELNIHYLLRSCDFHRHFHNDVYLTTRLAHWVLNRLRCIDNKWNEISLGHLTMDIINLHVFYQEHKML